MKSDDGLPRRFGRYLLERRMGHGGMAEVFRARIDEGAFRKPVCIKRILPHLAGQPGFANMFRDEASLAARCTHANIVQVLDFGELDGTLFMSLELVDGVSLDVVLKERAAAKVPLPMPVALHIALCMCRALHAAHTVVGDDGKPLKIVHRDISPHNVLLGRDGSVRIGDFGIARAVERLTRTNTGVIKGKPSYMAPEQALSEPSDHRVDQFATGIVLWEMLACRPLFRGTSPLAVLDAVVQARVPAVPRADVDAPLSAAVARALARSPQDRFTDMAAFEKAIEAALVRLRATPADIDVRPVVERATAAVPRTLVDEAPTDDEGVAYAQLVATSSSGVWQAPDRSAEPTRPEPASVVTADDPATATPATASPPAPEAPMPGRTVETPPTAQAEQRVLRVVSQPRGLTPSTIARSPSAVAFAPPTRSTVAIGAAVGLGVVAALVAVAVASRGEQAVAVAPPRPALCPSGAVATNVERAMEERTEGRVLLERGDHADARRRFELALRLDPTVAWGYSLLAEALPPDEAALRIDAVACACAIAPGTEDCLEARLWLQRQHAGPPSRAAVSHDEVAAMPPPAAAPVTTPRPDPATTAVGPVVPPAPEPIPADDDRAPARRIDSDAAVKEARAFYLQGKHDKVLETIRPVTKAERDNATAWKLLGMSAQKLNKLQTMCHAYGELMRIQPTGPDAEQARTNRKLANCK